MHFNKIKKLFQNNHLRCANSHHFRILSVFFPSLALVVLSVFHRATFSLKHFTGPGCHLDHICQEYYYFLLLYCLNGVYFYPFLSFRQKSCNSVTSHTTTKSVLDLSSQHVEYMFIIQHMLFFQHDSFFEHPKAWLVAI